MENTLIHFVCNGEREGRSAKFDGLLNLTENEITIVG